MIRPHGSFVPGFRTMTPLGGVCVSAGSGQASELGHETVEDRLELLPHAGDYQDLGDEVLEFAEVFGGDRFET